tara:strand:- start:416 stop:619 length:204 start_codon:yes stop_codon:yes gene_type:complete
MNYFRGQLIEDKHGIMGVIKSCEEIPREDREKLYEIIWFYPASGICHEIHTGKELEKVLKIKKCNDK